MVKFPKALRSEHWADRSILTRSWELGPCSHCGQTWFIENLSIQRPILCQNCGHRMLLPERLRIGYSLAPAVKHSLEQGIVPVVLAGRFLRNLTHRGFFWLPGVKHKNGEDYGDVDIIACCDGQLVFAECKTLTGILPEARVWKDVVAQFLDLTDVAVSCAAGLVVLASQVDRYPDKVSREIEDRLKDRIRFLLLDGRDLEVGHRKVGNGRWLSMHDLSRKYSRSRLRWAV